MIFGVLPRSWARVGRATFARGFLLRLCLLCSSCSVGLGEADERSAAARATSPAPESSPPEPRAASLEPGSTRAPSIAPELARDLAPRAPEPTTLFSLPESAYGATLAFDEDALLLLTSSALYRWEPGEGLSRVELALGPARTVTPTAVLFWSEGAFWSVPKRGGRARVVGKLPQPPRELVSSRERLAWLAHDGKRDEIRTLSGGASRLLHATEGELNALVTLDGSIFFVERGGDASWRIGRVSLDGGEPAFTRPRAGRTPSLLAASGDAVFYYDGPTRSVRRVSPDFVFDEAVAEKIVCSPIAASPRVFCGQVGGLVEVPLDSSAPQLLTPSPSGALTTLTANDSLVAWLNDSGENQLTLSVLPLSAEEASLSR